MLCVDFFLVVVVKIGPYYGHFAFFTNLSIGLSWAHKPPPPIMTKLNYVKNGPFFKTTTQKKNQHSAYSYYFFYCFHKQK